MSCFYWEYQLIRRPFWNGYSHVLFSSVKGIAYGKRKKNRFGNFKGGDSLCYLSYLFGVCHPLIPQLGPLFHRQLLIRKHRKVGHPSGPQLSGPQFFKDPYIEARTVLPDEFKAAGLDEALVVFNEIDTANKESPNFVIPEFRDSKTKEELRPWLGRIAEDFRDKKEASISAFRYFLFAISSKPKEVQRDQIAQLAVSFQHCGDGRLDAMIKLTAQLENRDTSDGVYAGPIVGKIIQKFKQDLLYEMFVNDKHLQASHGRNYVMARYGELIGAAGAPSFDHFVLTKEMSSLVSGSLRDKCLFTRDPTAKRNNVKEFLVPEYQRRLIQHVGKEINRLLEAPVVGLKAYNALVGILTDPEVCFELIEDDGHSLKILITPEGTKQILEALGYIVPEKPA